MRPGTFFNSALRWALIVVLSLAGYCLGFTVFAMLVGLCERAAAGWRIAAR